MDEMEEITIEYENFDGEFVSKTYFVPSDLKEWIEKIVVSCYEAENKVEYWKHMMGIHISEGVSAN